MTEFKIEKNVKMPKSYGGGPLYPWGKMIVSNSFFVPSWEGEKTQRTQSRVSAAARVWGKRNNVKFASRQVDGGVRIWRVE